MAYLDKINRMPEQSLIIQIGNVQRELIMPLAYGALQKLNWNTKYAGDEVLISYTPRKWNRYDHEIEIRLQEDGLNITSRMIHNELADALGRNKKFIAQFTEAFETVKETSGESQIAEWSQKIEVLRQQTVVEAEKQVAAAAEIDSVMNFSKSNLYLTYSLICLNAVIFLIMVLSGVNAFAPTGIDIMNWGGNHATLTLSGDWWRLLTCMFVHIGILHLLLNMYGLYMVGIYLEPLLGKPRFLIAYLCTGVMASVASLWWHDTPVASAGASGAIFGMYGVFLALLLTNLIPSAIRQSLLKSIGIFVAINLFYGMKAGVDNAAHVGGLASGIIIGLVYYFNIKRNASSNRQLALLGIICLLTVAVAFYHLKNNRVSQAQRQELMEGIEFYGSGHSDEFERTYDQIIILQDTALSPLKSSSLTDQEKAERINTLSIPAWLKADSLSEVLKSHSIGEKAKALSSLMGRYIDYRIEEARLQAQVLNAPNDSLQQRLNSVTLNINQVVDEMNGVQN